MSWGPRTVSGVRIAIARRGVDRGVAEAFEAAVIAHAHERRPVHAHLHARGVHRIGEHLRPPPQPLNRPRAQQLLGRGIT